MFKQKLFVALAFCIFVLLIVVSFLKPTQQQVTHEIVQSDSYIDVVNANLVSGGVGKDDIPAIDAPVYVSGDEDVFLSDNDIVFGFFDGSNWKALPRSIMYWHEVVNEKIDNEDASITYCPLTGSAIGYKGQYGVSGKLYNSNLVLYDKSTDSEIPQVLGTAVNGPLKGSSLERFPVVVTSWKKWKKLHPDTLVLSPQTGFGRDYSRNPYPGYETLLRVWFPVAAESNLFPSKKLVVGIENNGEFLAVPKDEFKSVKQAKIMLGGEEISVYYDEELDVVKATNFAGKELLAFDVYWFAWFAYHPDTKIFN